MYRGYDDSPGSQKLSDKPDDKSDHQLFLASAVVMITSFNSQQGATPLVAEKAWFVEVNETLCRNHVSNLRC